MKRYRETWVVRNRPGNVSELMRAFGLSDVCARIIWNRGYQSVSDVSSFLYGHDEPIVWPKLPGEEEFLFQAAQALSDGDKIRIIGDYDVDGVTATYLMCRALRLLGAEVDYRIPDRVADGYGISAEMAEEAARDGVRTSIRRLLRRKSRLPICAEPWSREYWRTVCLRTPEDRATRRAMLKFLHSRPYAM